MDMPIHSDKGIRQILSFSWPEKIILFLALLVSVGILVLYVTYPIIPGVILSLLFSVVLYTWVTDSFIPWWKQARRPPTIELVRDGGIPTQKTISRPLSRKIPWAIRRRRAKRIIINFGIISLIGTYLFYFYVFFTSFMKYCYQVVLSSLT